MSQPVDLRNLTYDELVAWLQQQGQKPFRAQQLVRWLYHHNVTAFDAMTDLAKTFRAQLADTCYVSALTPAHVAVSQDGTRKYLFALEDGETIETVRIPMEDGRVTLCISTQVGCAMGCRFCHTASQGLVRHLTAAEIVNQVCAALHDGPVNNIVFMGMGEPLHNLAEVLRAIKILYLPEGLAFGPRRVTVSTCGLVPQMAEFGQQARANLAISLNATTDEQRDALMPVNKRYPLAQLLQACRQYPLPPRQRITFEYLLIDGFNDSVSDARRLVKLLHGIKAKINLIPFNAHPEAPYQPPAEERISVFQQYLWDRHMVAVRRISRGTDIQAACGQLRGQNQEAGSPKAAANSSIS